ARWGSVGACAASRRTASASGSRSRAASGRRSHRSPSTTRRSASTSRRPSPPATTAPTVPAPPRILRGNPPPPRGEMAGPDDQRFVRRVGAVLVAEHDGGTAPSGEEGADVVADAVQFLRIGGGDPHPPPPNPPLALSPSPPRAL